MSSLAKSILRSEGTDYVRQYMDGIMQGMTMTVTCEHEGKGGIKAYRNILVGEAV